MVNFQEWREVRGIITQVGESVNDDNWLLQTVTSLNFARSHCLFSYASLKVWNSLPLSLREIETLSFFKKRLEAYYFNLAFEFDASILLLIAVELVPVLCTNFISV